MGKFDLQKSPSSRPAVSNTFAEVEVLSGEDNVQKSSKLRPDDISSIVNGGINVAQSSVEIARLVVETQAKIGIIRAITEQEIAKIDGEIRKIVSSTEAEISKLKTQGEEWRKNFTEKRKIVDGCLIQLNAHPEYSDEIKTAIIGLATKSLESN